MALNIAQARDQSIQRRHDNISIAQLSDGYYFRRKALLPRRGSYRRDYTLREFYYQDYSLIFRSAVAGLVKRIQSTPWELTSDEDTAHYQQMLWNADLGSGWENFLSRVVVPFFRSDIGGMVEIIGPGEPDMPLIGQPTGIAALNALECTPTGDPEYPVLYQGAGKYHKLHRSRVVQLADTLDSDYIGLIGYGDCALARYIGAAQRDITMGRYIEQFLDDNPRPGIAVFKNISEDGRSEAMERMFADMGNDQSEWGRVLAFETMMPDMDMGMEYFTFTEAPEKFDFKEYTELNVKLVALALGVDIQDVWELTGGGIGTGTQSQVLAAKSRGKALGRLLKAIERLINQTLPRHVEFTFRYEDAQQDLERAQTEEAYARIFATISGALTPDEQRAYLANQMQSVADAIADVQNGDERLNDADLEPYDPTVDTADDSVEVDEEAGERALSNAFDDWTGDFIRVYNAVKNPLTPASLIRTSFRRNLQLTGERALREGMRDAGDEDAVIDANARRELDRWLSEQAGYIDRLITDFTRNDYTRDELERRAKLWQDKSVRAIYYEGVDLGTAGGAMFKWKLNPAKENCLTCQTLNGQVHRYKTFKSRNLVPGSGALECGGWNCGCDLIQQPPGTKAFGNIRRVPFVRGRKEHACTHEGCTHD